MEYLKDNTERVLAIDFGQKRIGTAITDPLKLFAIPLKTIPNDHNLWKNLKDILREYNVVDVIIGDPIKEDGTKSELDEEIKYFVSVFKKKFNIVIKFVDERYSSSIAWEHILESVPSKKKRRDKGLIDKNAAAVILEDYLKTIE